MVLVAELRCDSTSQPHRREHASSSFTSSDGSLPEPSPSPFALAQQGARANATVRHASCFFTYGGMHKSDRTFYSCTSHAGRCRGSSLTLGKG